MPYLPPVDLPPPPIVQTVSLPAAVAAEPPLEPAVKADERSSAKPQPRFSHPAPATAPPGRRQNVSNPTAGAVNAADVEPLTPAEVQASFLQGGGLTPPLAPQGASLHSDRSATVSREEDRVQSFPTLSAPWVSQSDDDEAEAADETAPRQVDEADGDEEDDDGDEENAPAIVYPRAATPGPDWSNGAVLPGGDLLPPSSPTNQPPTPLNLVADYQEFEPATQIVTARGNVVLRLTNGVLSAERLWANLANRYVVDEGNVIFTRGDQTVEADRGEYNLIQGEGSLFQARGVLFLPQTGRDFGDLAPTGAGPPVATSPGVLDTDPIGNVRGTGSITFGTGLDPDPAAGAAIPSVGGFVRRIRFEAAQLDFDAAGWYAQDIRLTNAPFSPPELEFRGETARLTRLTEFQDELFVDNPRLVFDQSFSLPLFRETILLSRGGPDSANPFFVNFGYDGEERDGLFVERTFQLPSIGQWEFFLTPQFLVQRFAGEETDSFLSNFGLEADATGALSPTTLVEANASFSGLDLDNLEERLRASVRVQQLLGDHSLNFEYSYRDRLFNGSLGFQDVQSSLGVVLLSPNILLGDTGIVLNYQASAQYITANTDRLELLDDLTPPFRASLGRFQGSVGLTRGFVLWQGTPLPATRDEGLRFTPNPRTPIVVLTVGARGTYTYYTSDDTQENLSAFAGISGELGHFSRDFLDSTVFNLTYSRAFVGQDSTSPFLFDRNVDQNTLTGGLIQQIYGPFRVGFQASFNLDTGELINNDYIFEYNRRTYGLFLRFNPTQQVGFLGFRLNEFDWSGRAARFGGADIDQVEGGVVR